MESALTQQHVGGGMRVINEPKPHIGAGEYVEGATHMQKMRQDAPIGAANFGMFMNRPGGAKVLAPMEKPIMQRHINRCRQWFSSYLSQVRPEGPLKDTENVPKLLILVMAMYYAEDVRSKWELIECMRGTTIPLSTSQVVTVPWEYQTFTSVPYAVTEMPLAVAITILEHCANSVYDDLKPMLDRSRGTNGKVIMGRLADENRPRVGPAPFRNPTPEEEEALKRDFGVTIDTPLAVGSEGGASLLMDFGGTKLKATNSINTDTPGPNAAGSVPAPNAAAPAQVTQPAGAAPAPFAGGAPVANSPHVAGPPA